MLNDITAENLDSFGRVYIQKYSDYLIKDVTGQIYQVIGEIIGYKEYGNNLKLAKSTVSQLFEQVEAEISRLRQ